MLASRCRAASTTLTSHFLPAAPKQVNTLISSNHERMPRQRAQSGRLNDTVSSVAFRMSRAFLRESDMPDPTETLSRVATLPSGAKNHMTAEGAALLSAKLEKLLKEERPRLVARSKESVGLYEVQKLDTEIRRLQVSLQSAEIASPEESGDVVRLGSTVTVRDQKGHLDTYRIVGVDETDLFESAISWQSPLARALTGARVGDRVSFRAPQGEQRLDVVEVH